MDNTLNDKLENFFSQFKQVTFSKGEIIIRPDNTPQGVYFIKEGYARMYSTFADGRELTLNIFKPRTYFSMMWALADIANTYYFQAHTRVIVQKAPQGQVKEFLQANPDILFNLTKRILVGLDGILTNIEYLLSGQAAHRVMAALFLSAKRFGQPKENNEVIINLPLTHQDIANLAGLTRETTSIEMGKLTKKKLISYNKRLIIINDIAKLEAEIIIYKNDHSLPYTL
ncbi:MAG: Crp/Fnr family transcriptional regulator [Candidatus Gottesmanbacteria bacterium]